MLQVMAQTPGIPMALVATWVMDASTDPSCGMITDPDMI